jgi:hypothetical protein
MRSVSGGMTRSAGLGAGPGGEATPMRIRSLTPPALALAAVLALGACSKPAPPLNESAGSVPKAAASSDATDPSTDPSLDPTLDPTLADQGAADLVDANAPDVDPTPSSVPATTPGTSAPKPPPPAPKPPAPTSGGGTNAAPTVTSFHGPAGGVHCVSQYDMDEFFNATYTVAHARYVEWLEPTSDRPGSGNADGTVSLHFDCSKSSQVFKLRAFNEYNGMDSKNPSAYVTITVNRVLPKP